MAALAVVRWLPWCCLGSNLAFKLWRLLTDGFSRRSGPLYFVCVSATYCSAGTRRQWCQALPAERLCLGACSRQLGGCRAAETQASDMTASHLIDVLKVYTALVELPRRCMYDVAPAASHAELLRPSPCTVRSYASGAADALIRCHVGNSPWQRRSWSAKRLG